MNFTQLINGIEICDNAFDEKIINTFYSKIKNNCFHFWGKSEPNDEPSFWKLPLFVEEKNWTNSDFVEEINYFSKSLNKKFNRIYVNGQTFGQSGSFHTDGDSATTYLLYPDFFWDIKRGGGTEFKILNNDTTVVVYPKFNRLIRFNATIKHRSLPNIDPKGLRVSVAFKTQEENNSD